MDKPPGFVKCIYPPFPTFGLFADPACLFHVVLLLSAKAIAICQGNGAGACGIPSITLTFPGRICNGFSYLAQWKMVNHMALFQGEGEMTLAALVG